MPRLLGTGRRTLKQVQGPRIPPRVCGLAWYTCGFGSHRPRFKSAQTHSSLRSRLRGKPPRTLRGSLRLENARYACALQPQIRADPLSLRSSGLRGKPPRALRRSLRLESTRRACGLQPEDPRRPSRFGAAASGAAPCPGGRAEASQRAGRTWALGCPADASRILPAACFAWTSESGPYERNRSPTALGASLPRLPPSNSAGR